MRIIRIRTIHILDRLIFLVNILEFIKVTSLLELAYELYSYFHVCFVRLNKTLN